MASAVVVHPSPLLDSLLRLFDLMWEQATPSLATGTGTRSGLTDTEAAVLGVLAAGEKGEAITCLMGVHVRTFRATSASYALKLGAPHGSSPDSTPQPGWI